jgi:hypothetical protein
MTSKSSPVHGFQNALDANSGHHAANSADQTTPNSRRDKFKNLKKEETPMKKASLFASILALALALGASAQSVNFASLPAVSNPTVLPNNYSNLNWSGFYYVDPISIGADAGTVKPPIIIIGPSAPKKTGPITHESENTIADTGSVSPPIIILGPSAPKKTGPITRESQNTIADSHSIHGLPPVVTLPTPKKPSPVAHESENTIADSHSIHGLPPVVTFPTPKRPSPVAHESENTIADTGSVSPPIIIIGPNAPKKPAPSSAHISENAST